MFETILFPIDQSAESREAADTVVQLAKLHKGRVVLLSVLVSTDDASEIEAANATANALLDGAKKLFSDQDIPVETRVRSGKVAFTICDVADEIEAGLIIMGSRGLGLTQESTTESTAHRVIDLAPCPVLIML